MIVTVKMILIVILHQILTAARKEERGRRKRRNIKRSTKNIKSTKKR